MRQDAERARTASRPLSEAVTPRELLHLTAAVASEIYVSRAGEPVTMAGHQRTYDVQDAVAEAAALLTWALTSSLAADVYRVAAASYGVQSLFDAVTEAAPMNTKMQADTKG